MRVLNQSRLPGESIAVHTDGVVEGFPENAKFAHITLNPTIKGGDVNRKDEYEQAAQVARDRCFIGRTVRDYLTYDVGQVAIA